MSKEDHQRSVARSVSSLSTAANALTVVRFNPVDELLFATVYTLHKEKPMSNFFYFVWLALTFFNLSGIAVVWGKYPFHKNIASVAHGIFQYTDFTISWMHNLFLLPMIAIFGVLTLISLIVIIISTIFVKTEKPVPTKLASLIRVISMLMAYPFYMPSLNAFLGGLNCIRKDGLVGMDCDDSLMMVNLIVGLVCAVLLALFTLLVRFFVFPFNSRKDGLFASQTGIFNTFVWLVTTAMPILTIFLKSTPQFVCLAGLVLSLGLFIYAFFLLPFYSDISNAVCAAVFADVAVFHLIGMIWSFVGNDKLWLNTILWVVWGLAFVGVPVGVFFGTRAYARAQWATRPGEPIPYIHKKEVADAPAILSAQPTLTPKIQPSIPPFGSLSQGPVSSRAPLTPAVQQPSINLPQAALSSRRESNETSLLFPTMEHNKLSPTEVEMEEFTNINSTTPRIDPPHLVTATVSSPSASAEPTPSASYQPSVGGLGMMGTPKIQTGTSGLTHPQSAQTRSTSGQPSLAPTYNAQQRRPSLQLQTGPSKSPRSNAPGQSVQSKLLSEQVNRKVPKYTNPRQVQEAIKFLVEKECRKNRDYVSLADEILTSAQKKMPTSSELWICSAFFYLSHTNSQMKMGDCLRTANQCVPSLHERWVVYALMRDMERKTSAQGGQNSQGVSFKLNVAKATKAHDMSRAYLQQAYLLLSKENMDLDRIMLFLDKAIGFEKEAHEIYQSLLRQYPNSAQVLRGFGALIRDIYRDDDTAMMMFTEANIIEEDTTVTETMSRVSGGSKLSSIAGQSTGQPKKKKKRNRSGTTIQLDEDKKKLLPMFIPIVVISGVVIVGAMVVMFIIVTVTFDACATTTLQVTKFSEIITSILDMVLYANFYILRTDHDQTYFDNLGCTFIPIDWQIKETFKDRSGKLGEGLHVIYKDAVATSEFQIMEYEEIPNLIPAYQEVQVGSARQMRVTGTTPVFVNLIDFINNIANVASLIYNDGFWNTTEWKGQPVQLYYLILNGPVAATERMKIACLVFSGNSEGDSRQMQIVDIIVGVASIVFPIILLLAQYIQTISSLKRERREIFFQIAIARKDDVLRLKQRLDDSESGVDDETNMSTRFGTTTNQTNTETNNSNDEEGADGEGLDSARAQHDEEEKLKMQLIAQGMNPQMIAMMQMQGMSLQQISEMMGKKKEEEDEDEEEEKKEEKNKEEEKEETRSQRLKREAEEKKKAEEEEKKAKKNKKGLDHLTPHQQEIYERVYNMSGIIAASFFVRVIIGFILIVVGALFFYLIAYFACDSAVKYYNSVILTAYKCVVAEQMGLLAISIANSINYEIPGIYTTVPYAGGPWLDSRHLSSDMGLIQTLLSEELEYFNAIDQLVSQGSDSVNVYPTGDEDFDGLTVVATIKKGSTANAIMYESRECFQLDDGDCDVKNRIYGQTGNYSGLQALVLKFKESARSVADSTEPYSGISIGSEHIQIMGSLLTYDLRGGFLALQNAVVDEMNTAIDLFRALLIVSFIVAIVLNLLAFVAFIVPTKSILAKVANSTEAMRDIDPAADAADRTGMGQAAWKEEYTSDCIRFDHEHKIILHALAATCGCLDTSMEVVPSVESLKEVADDETKEMLDQAINLFMVKGDGAAKVADDEVKQKEKAKVLLSVLALLVKSTFSGFHDEEQIIQKYKIQRAHRRGHYKAHSAHLRKLQKESLGIAKFVRGGKPVPAAHGQNLIQMYTQWLTEHVTKVDRELSALLAGNAPESEMEREMDILHEMHVPSSYSAFLDSENASIQDQKLFEKMKHVLRIK
ncbi:hypothetical protein BLNAU_15245 [Blattamonas nauphoetae]|uniref:TmcB/TmcC TPR repeats domain-containing protein n=1 Tax=Blattamonas nauphoetae TaxID=2049346 RepID=A0ABQ9XEM7_9EUKA|nr:hypothetical protein BLNAU_15245 [Blattamonas nauphoetae]